VLLLAQPEISRLINGHHFEVSLSIRLSFIHIANSGHYLAIRTAMAEKDMKPETTRFEDEHLVGELLFETEKKPIAQVLRENPYVLGLACVSLLINASM
jgi:hypothetical protein